MKLSKTIAIYAHKQRTIYTSYAIQRVMLDGFHYEVTSNWCEKTRRNFPLEFPYTNSHNWMVETLFSAVECITFPWNSFMYSLLLLFAWATT